MRRKYGYGRYHFLQPHYRMLLLRRRSSVYSPTNFDREATFAMGYFQISFQFADTFPWIFIQETKTAVSRVAPPQHSRAS